MAAVAADVMLPLLPLQLARQMPSSQDILLTWCAVQSLREERGTAELLAFFLVNILNNNIGLKPAYFRS